VPIVLSRSSPRGRRAEPEAILVDAAWAELVIAVM